MISPLSPKRGARTDKKNHPGSPKSFSSPRSKISPSPFPSSSLSSLEWGPNDDRHDIRDAILPGLLSVVSLLALVGVAGKVGVPRVERHLAADVRQGVQTKILGVQIRFDGRDAIVTGRVETSAKLAQLRSEVSTRWGVRSVSLNGVTVDQLEPAAIDTTVRSFGSVPAIDPVPTIPDPAEPALGVVPTVPSTFVVASGLGTNLGEPALAAVGDGVAGISSTSNSSIFSASSSTSTPSTSSTAALRTGASAAVPVIPTVPPVSTTTTSATIFPNTIIAANITKPSTTKAATTTIATTTTATTMPPPVATSTTKVPATTTATTKTPTAATSTSKVLSVTTSTTKAATTTSSTTTSTTSTMKPATTTTTTAVKVLLPATTTTAVPVVPTSTVAPLAFDPNIVAAQIDFVLVDQPLEFVDSSVALRPSAGIPLDLIASLLAGAPDARFAIEVHTDGRGAPAKNLTLSKRRAETIRRALATRSVPTSRLLIDGRGEAEPIANDATAQGQAANRRVLFVYRPTPSA